MFTVASYYGQGSYFGPAFVLLALTGLIALRKRRELLIFAATAQLILIPYLFYFFLDGRLISPLLVMAVPVVAAGFVAAFKGGRRMVRILLVLLLICHLIIFPGTRLHPDMGRYLDIQALEGPARKYELVQNFRSLQGNAPSLILTDLRPPYVYALTEGLRIISPLKEAHDYRHNPEVFVFGKQEQAIQMRDRHRLGWQVYALGKSKLRQLLKEAAAPPAGTAWKVLWTNQADGGIAKLVAEDQD